MKRKPAATELDWESRILQRKLKALGVPPPAPAGQPVKPGILKKAQYYAVVGWDAKHAYLLKLRELFASQSTKWTDEACLHTVLAAAQKAAPETERLRVCHQGVPARPVIANAGYVALCVLAADAVAHLVPAAEQKEFRKWVEFARPVRERDVLTKAQQKSQQASMNTWLHEVSATTPALILAQSTALAADCCSSGDDAGKVTRQAVVTALQMLAAEGKPGAARQLLEAMDRLILKEDALTQLTKMKQQPRSPVVAAAWRGVEKGKATHWLVQLEQGFALWWKVRGQWRLVEGSREDVLASVPDAQMASATVALLNGNQRAK